MATLEELKNLSHGDILHHVSVNNKDRSPARCRVNGKLKLWKTRPDDFRLPVKYGIYTCFYITPENADEWVVSCE